MATTDTHMGNRLSCIPLNYHMRSWPTLRTNPWSILGYGAPLACLFTRAASPSLPFISQRFKNRAKHYSPKAPARVRENPDVPGVVDSDAGFSVGTMPNSTCPTCGDDFKSQRGMRQHHTRTHGESLTTVEGTCEECGDEFERDVHDSSSDSGPRFCSQECHLSHDGWYETGRNTVTRTCEWCGDTFDHFPAAERRLCSKECQHSWMAEEFKGENGPNYKHGKNVHYGSTWRKNRDKALERDNHQCQICGKTEAGHVEERGHSLHVHHKQPRSEFVLDDGSVDPEADELQNLVTLCSRHHAEWESAGFRPEPTAP